VNDQEEKEGGQEKRKESVKEKEQRTLNYHQSLTSCGCYV